MEFKDLLDEVVKRKASDLHLTEDSPPILRIDGSLVKTNHKPLTRSQLKEMILNIMSDEGRESFERNLELDFSLALPKGGRFRVNVHMQRGATEAAFRWVPEKISTMAELGLPPKVADLARKFSGLVLLAGPTGNGKSTTLASMVNLINKERTAVVVSIEDPIEYVHKNNKSIIKQREVYSDTHSFPEALKRCLRQDPDVIVVGELRDLESMATALTAAETGHLVLATLHTPDAAQTIERIVDVFPPYQQPQIKLQLANTLQGIVSHMLLPKVKGTGRVLATEILIATSGVRNLIREQAVEQIPTAIQTGAQYGMQTMDKSLRELCKAGLISYDLALTKVKEKEEFEQAMKKA